SKSARAGAKRARRGKPAKRLRKSAAARDSGKRIRSGSLPRRRAPRAASRAIARAAASGRPARNVARRPRGAGGRAAEVAGVQVTGKLGPRYQEVLTPDALAFLAELHRRFDATRKRLLARRAARQARFDAGELPDCLHQARHLRDSDWRIAPIPADLLDRRVEITGPVDRKMIINALNSGANVYMADFEDANSPTWANNIEGQLNLKERWAGRLAFTDATT